jgi:hypothetical protein
MQSSAMQLTIKKLSVQKVVRSFPAKIALHFLSIVTYND